MSRENRSGSRLDLALRRLWAAASTRLSRLDTEPRLTRVSMRSTHECVGLRRERTHDGPARANLAGPQGSVRARELRARVRGSVPRVGAVELAAVAADADTLARTRRRTGVGHLAPGPARVAAELGI